MDFSDERINYDDILKEELAKVFPIFRWTKPAQIFTAVFLFVTNFVPIIMAIVSGTRHGGFLGQAEIFAAIFALGVQAFWAYIIYRLYVTDRMEIFWIIFVIGIALDIFFSGNWFSALFKIWLGLAVLYTKKAIASANRVYSDLSEARRYSQEKEMRKKLADPETYRNSGETSAAPIDNSNLFGNNSEETIDNFNEPIDLSRIFAKPNSEK